MAYDCKRYFGEVTVIRDMTTMPEEAGWRATAAAENDEQHPIVLSLGCNVFRTFHTIQTITAIFDRLGLDCVAVDGPTRCCGTHSAHSRPLATGRTLRRGSGGFR